METTRSHRFLFKGDTHTGVLAEMAIVAAVIFPACCLIAAPIGLAGWAIWGTEEGGQAFVIAGGTAMVIAQIAIRRLFHDLDLSEN